MPGYEKQKQDRYIPKSAFSFKNVHINMGKVRWYSTIKAKNNN